MNVHLRNTKFWSVIGILLFAVCSLIGQNYKIDPPEEYEVVQGQTYDYIYSHFGPQQFTRIVNNLTSSHHGIYNNSSNPRPQRIGATSYKVSYNTNVGTTGLDTLTIEYFQSGFTYRRRVIFNVVPSIVKAEDDFICIPLGASVGIPIENNDYSNRSVLNITDISVENNGTVSIANNIATFTPANNFEGLANFNYVICDDIGTCDKATVHVCVGDPNGYTNSNIDLITKKNKDLPVFTPLDDYSNTQNPSNGTLTSMNGILYYSPNAGYHGTDEFKYTHNITGVVKTISVNVLNIEANNEYVKDDLGYSFVDDAYMINVLENDEFGISLFNVSIVNGPSNGSVVQVPGLKGIYIYTPNAGFSGIDEFTYSASPASNGSNPEEGVVSIIVNDLNPAFPAFDLRTPVNTPLVIDYNIEPTSFIFNITSTPNKGNVIFLPGSVDTTINNQVIKGNNIIVYTPNANSTGHDEFEMEYCTASGTNCPTVKVNVDIQSISSGNICFGTDCVWPGDANDDGIVDLKDMLPTAWCIGDVGTSRSSATINPWHGQSSPNWGIVFPHTDVDLKHLDANGDSLINISDTIAIGQHYQKNHSLSPSPISFPANIPLFLGTPDTIHVVGPGDTIRIPIILGDPSYPAKNMYGLTFNIDYDPSVVNPAGTNIHFDKESWANYTSPVMNMVKSPFIGRLDAAYSRTNGVTTDGYGRVGHVDFVIIEDLEIQKLPEKFFARINGSFFDGNGSYTDFDESLVTFKFKDQEDVKRSNDVHLFPNPTSDYINYQAVDGNENINEIEVFDITGKAVLRASHQQLNGRVNTSQYHSGVYLMRVNTTTGIVTKKFRVSSGK